MKLGDNPCVIVAHPDDEVLWAGGLILSNPGLKWTVICCSIPRIDTERAWLWNDACDRLGVSDKKLFPALESPPDQYLGALPEVKGYSAYITHGFDGEYGHLHHRQVHHHVKLSADAPVYCFSLNGKHNHELRLAEETYNKKLDALKAYSHIAPYPYLKDVPKWRALLHRYSEMDGLDFRIERFETMPIKYQWHVIEDFVKKHDYKIGAELGVRFGQTSRYLLENCKDLKVIGVDLMQINEDADVSKGEETYENWDWNGYRKLIKSIEDKFGDRFDMRIADTTEVSKTIPDGSLDWVFIDADHSYNGVLTDIKNWTPKVRKGGIVIGHDIDRPGIRKAVNESFREWETMEKKYNNCWWSYVER